MKPLLVIRRLPYEEPYHTQLEFVVRNTLFSAQVDIYCGVPEIAEMGRALQAFPTKIGGSYTYEYGSADPAAKFYRHFKLRAYTVDNVGHCALQFTVNLNTPEPSEGSSQFSIEASPAEINRLGELLVNFAQLKHLELRWTPHESGLFEAYGERDA
jgi:hypothetical protein